MPYQSAPSLLRRWLAGLLALMIGLGPLASPAYAALTPLADEPINIKNQAKPNIILTVDDSTSMLYDFLPDYVASNKYCRDRTGAMNTSCGYSGSPINTGSSQYVSPQYIWEQPSMPYPSYGTGTGAVPASFSPQLFSKSGPGAGCNLLSIPPSCSGGIDPGALPGIAIYPGASGSPLAGQPYEYWLLWPAPVHNSALNHMYYNPRLTYDPPAYADATSYPQMDSGNTVGWTKVRADPFTTPSTPTDCSSEPCADLTASVIVGQWCNSDWTQGNDDSGNPFASNAAYCRTNGLKAAASNGSPVALGDYMYPWTPTGITPNDVNSKVDMSTVSTNPASPTNATVKPAWTGAQDTKYFYENDNVLWCDISNPEWPQTITNPVAQTCSITGPAPTCDGFRAVGTCSATSAGNCNGFTAGTCNTANGNCAGYTAGACNLANGVCAGFTGGACNTANGLCAGVVAGACNTTSGNCNSAPGTCNTGFGTCAGVTAGTCNTANGNCSGGNGTCNTANGNCGGFVAGACSGAQAGSCGSATSCAATHETCLAGITPVCGGKAPQTCNGGTPKSCDSISQSCSGADGAQTCKNIVSIPPDPSTCTSAWEPLGCNLNPDPEGTCIYKTTCPPPTFAGKCSKQTSKVCTSDADCPFIYGTCSIETTKQCTTNADCTGLKYCHNTTTVCASSATCGINSGSGTCSKTGASCTVNTDCVDSGTCNYQTNVGVPNGVCTANTDCKGTPSNCQTTTGTTGCAVGANSLSCPLVPNSGTCLYASSSGGSCTTLADCGKLCQNAGKLGTACASDVACNVSGTCSAGKPSTTVCSTATDCDKTGACTTGTNTGTACSANGSNALCGPINKCSAGLPNTTTCTASAQCNTSGTCTTGPNTGAACTGAGANAACGPFNKCSAGLPNTTTCTANAQCNTTGACISGANNGAACTVNGVNAACGAVNKCTVGKVGITCTTNAQCNTDGTCTTGTNTGTACTVPGVNAACGPINKCSAGLPNTTSCTTAANCNKAGACTTGANTGATCATNGVNAACGAVNKCTAGKDPSTTCANNAACDVSGSCQTGANTGLACGANGVNAACGAVNKCTAGLPSTTTCANNGACTVNGACTTGPNAGNSCTANGANPTCGAINKCSAGSIGMVCTADATCTVTGICTTGDTTKTCTANGPSNPQCALANGYCSNYPGNTQACTVANAATQCAGANGVCSNNGAQNCTDATVCATFGRCTISGAICTAANASTVCTDQPGPANPLNVACTNKTAISGITLLADANGLGKACRRNNHAYPDGTTASQTNYPSGKYTTPVMGEDPLLPGQGCTATARYATIPRHYWKTEVQWCDNSISTAGDKWLGYGDKDTGTCQDFKDSTHTFPRFYEFGAAAGTDNVSTAAFARVDLTAAKAPFQHVWVDDAGTTQTISRTYAEEMTNYANWFAYYRTRLQAVKTVTSLAFLGKTGNTLNLDDAFRVGFHTLSNNAAVNSLKDPATFVAVGDFDSTQKGLWATQLFGIQIPLSFETPNLNAMMRIGQYYSPGGSAELSGADPIILSCQKNWHMLFTDGFTNQPTLPATVVNDQDDSVPAAIPVNGATTVAVTGLTPGAPWPAPYREDPAGTASNSASDYSMNYWVTDLRPAMPMNVATSARDPASWPHLNFAAMSLGTEGKLPAGNQASVESQLSAGTLLWPQPYPNVYKPDISGVDDLWHAAVNGRGRFVNAQSADELKLGMGQILQDVINQAGSRAGAGFQSTTLSSSNAFIYRTTFEPGWGASLSKVSINPTTGAEISVVWEASAQLAALLTVVPTVKDTPWFTDRKVITVDEGGAAVPFLSGSIGTNQLDSLAPGKTARAKSIVEFLRGNRNNEGTKVGQFRVRVGGLLGDIVDSQPVYVGKPNAPYLEANDPGYTINFKNDAAFAGRPVRVYVGANDGMLHAFDDSNGNEAWAFIPSDLFRADETGLGALSYQDGALPPFVHHYYVDATPRITDVNFGGGDADWHSILVGGLGKGGKAYYAMDVSQPSDMTSEAEAAKRVLWRFSNDDLGYTYGKAIIAKTHAFGGQWVVIVPSGYNNVPTPTNTNPSGKGKIFILSAKDGSLLKTMTTNSGSTTSPSGLAQIAAYEKDYRNQFAEQVYGGDLDGNFWRFDISSSDDTAWTVEKIATFTDKLNGKAQPVTIPPQIEIDISNGVDRWVFIGTGRLLDDTDLTTPAIKDQIQTMYAIRDGTALAPVTPWPATLDGHADLLEVTNANGLAAKPDQGWFDDLPAGQRIVVPVQAALSLVAYIGTSPQLDPCLTGQPATVYAREYGRGNSLLLDDAGTPVESLFEVEGGVSIQLVALDGGSGDSSSGGFPDLRIAITAGTTGKVTYVKPKDPDFAQKHRMSWRLLGQ